MFRLRVDAEEWMRHVAPPNDPIDSKFDLYYLCLLVGLAGRRKSNPKTEGRKATDLVNYFIEDYKPSQFLIISLLIVAELGRLGINLDERKSVRKRITKLVKPNSQSGLTDYGMEMLNQYASGGFDLILSKRYTPPYNTEDLLRTILALTKELLNDNSYWKSMSQLELTQKSIGTSA